MQREEACRIGGGDQSAADDVAFVAGELPPEGGLQVHVLAHRHRADVGKRRRGGRHRLVELRQARRADHQRQVVVAEAGLAGAQRVLGGEHLAPLGTGLLVGGAEAAQRKIDSLAGDLPVRRREALGQHQFVRQAQDVVDQPGAVASGYSLTETMPA